MQKEHLLPKEVIQLTHESLVARYAKSSMVLYTTVLLFLASAIGVLPFVSVDVSVKAPVFFRPTAEVSSVSAPVSARIKKNFTSENKAVALGDTLFVLESESLSERAIFLTAKLREVTLRIGDLQMLATHSPGRSTALPELRTQLYKQADLQFRHRLNEIDVKLDKAMQDLDRNTKLFENKVIAPVEYENFLFEYTRAQKELKLVEESQLNQWAIELQGLLNEKNEIEGQLAEVKAEGAKLYVRAPISGELLGVKGLYEGSFVFANQELLQISPDSGIIAIAYVPPKDIGLIREEMPVRLQIEAFDYNQWGLAEASITSISNDIKVIDNRPVFEIRCALNKNYLELPNGHKGYLKKGMTAQARFLVQQRTLWQLLYDKIDDWINPNLNT